MSSTESMATPAIPTSPFTRGLSESYPRCVARSNATLKPCWPAFMLSLNVKIKPKINENELKNIKNIFYSVSQDIFQSSKQYLDIHAKNEARSSLK